MCQLGLLMPYIPPSSSSTSSSPPSIYLCPTPTAAVLAGSGAAASALERRDGFIIVETNYKVFAFTFSQLHRRVLQLFVRTETLLPGLFVGSVTRASVSAALDRGVSAEMMIEYLASHPHKQVAKRSPVVPEVGWVGWRWGGWVECVQGAQVCGLRVLDTYNILTTHTTTLTPHIQQHPHHTIHNTHHQVVSDQLRLWERETQRVEGQGAVLYQAFERSEYFFQCVAYAKQQGTWLYDDDRDSLIARQDGHEGMKAFIKEIKAQHQAG